jgi:hypothetical protein
MFHSLVLYIVWIIFKSFFLRLLLSFLQLASTYDHLQTGVILGGETLYFYCFPLLRIPSSKFISNFELVKASQYSFIDHNKVGEYRWSVRR